MYDSKCAAYADESAPSMTSRTVGIAGRSNRGALEPPTDVLRVFEKPSKAVHLHPPMPGGPAADPRLVRDRPRTCARLACRVEERSPSAARSIGARGSQGSKGSIFSVVTEEQRILEPGNGPFPRAGELPAAQGLAPPRIKSP
jgi:hypothetical protein